MQKLPVAIPISQIKGRGSATRLAHRFERDAREPFDDGWAADPEEATRIATTWTWEDAKSAISLNTSPDIGFDRSITPTVVASTVAATVMPAPRTAIWASRPDWTSRPV